MTPKPKTSPKPDNAANRRDANQAAEKWHAFAFAILLAIGAARCFLPELPFQGSALGMLKAAPIAASGVSDNPQAYLADRSELARMTFAIGLLAAGVLWLVGSALRGRLTVRCRKLAIAIGLFAALSLASALAASNRRAALDGWIEQLSLMLAAFMMIQLCRNRRRLIAAVVVMAALGATMAARGYWQVAVEAPQGVADFEANPAERLGQFGWQPGTPEADVFEARVRDWSAKGFLGAANPFGSMLIVLGFAALGLAVDKLRAASKARREFKNASDHKPGEVEPTTVAATLAAILAAATLVVILLTRSRGASLAAALAGAGLLAAFVWRDALARRWRKCVAWAMIALVALVAATAIYGLRNDRLPTKTLTFRWYYWTASMQILAENPLLGTGPGNFDDAYLRCRRDLAEEDIQMPHNVIVHALTEYGVAGGVCLLAVIGWLVLLALKPAAPPGNGDRLFFETQPRPSESQAPNGQNTSQAVSSPWAMGAVIVLGVMAARLILWRATESQAVILMQTIIPAAVLAVMLAALAWAGRGFRGLPEGAGVTISRIALAAAAVGFVVHNLVTFSLWMPGPATLFYLAVGAAAAVGAQAGQDGIPSGEQSSDAVKAPPPPAGSTAGLSWTLAAVAAGLVIAAVAIFWLPVASKTSHTSAMLRALRAGDLRAALEQADAAAKADVLDPRPAADAARVTLLAARIPGAPRSQAMLVAHTYARQAVARDADDWTYRRLLGELAWSALTAGAPQIAKNISDGDKAYLARKPDDATRNWLEAARLLPPAPAQAFGSKEYAEAVRLNPKNARLRMAFATNLLNANLPKRALAQLDEAWRLNEILPPESVQHLRDTELRRIDTLGARAAVLMGWRLAGSTTKPATSTAPATAPATMPATRRAETN